MFFRPLNLGAPSAPSLYKLSVDEFKGVDKASGEDNFSPSRATEMKNFIRDKVGRVKKRGGFVKRATRTTKIHWVDRWNQYEIRYEGHFVSITSPSGTSLYINSMMDLESIHYAVGYAAGEDYYIMCGDTGGDTESHIVFKLRELDLWIGILYSENKMPQVYEFDPIFNFGTFEKYWSDSLIESDVITTPEIAIASRPNSGGGLDYSPNLLSPFVTETFTVLEEDYDNKENPTCVARFQLRSKNITLFDEDGNKIDSEEWMTEGTYWTKSSSGYKKLTESGAAALRASIKIEVYTAVGDAEQYEYEWQSVNLFDVFAAESYNFVNTTSAALWIPTAGIRKSPNEGEASVRITYPRNFNEYKDGLADLMSCNLSTCYGVGGYKDRVFLAGGNKIFYSGIDDPLYFGELCYIEPCSADKSIVAMGGQGQVLYAVDSDGITHVISGTTTEEDTNTFLLDAAFIIADRVQGEKPIGSVLKIFGGEFCYLSEEGMVAIRHDNFYDKRYAQNRSRMLGDSIKGEIVGATVWGGFLVIATATELYLLDELQQTRLEDYKYSGVQYEVFPFAFDMATLGDFTIERVWTDGEDLRLLVAKDGAFYELVYDETARQDTIGAKSADIVAEWITPQFQLADVHRRKLIQELFLSVGADGDAVTVEYRTDNEDKWRTIRPADGRFVAFDYNSVDYGIFSYNVQVPKLQMIVRGRPDRRFYKIQFRFTSTGRHGLSLSSFGFYYKKEVI